MLKVAVVGVGGISGAHIPAWQYFEDTEIVAMCDVRPEMMDKYENVRKYTDYKEMLEKEELDIVDVCLPTYLHADYSVMALEKGINVICEKPISLKKEDVARVYAAAEKNNAKFMIAHVLRFWPEYTVLKEIYDKQTYGKLLSGTMKRIGNIPNWSWDGWMRDETRSGLVPFDLHIHDLDFIVYTFGVPKNTIFNRVKREDQDYLNNTYVYDDFFINAEASWYAGQIPFHSGFRFQFEQAVVVYEGGVLMAYEKDRMVNLSEPSKDDDGKSGVINLPKTNAYAEELRYFTDCVLAGKPADLVKPEELETVIDLLNGKQV